MIKILIVTLLFVCTTALAQNQLYIFFLNGVNTTPDEADANLSRLESIVPQNDNITWNVLYNATHGLIKSDLWEVMKQKAAERKDYGVKQYLIDNPNQTAERYLNDNLYVGKNLKDIVAQFHSRFPRDNKDAYALIVSHSQGNQYANQLWDYLINAEGFPKDHIALFGIATPTSTIEGDFYSIDANYVTADNDKVINMARILPDHALPANAHIEKCKDFSCHNFILDYMGDNKIRKLVCDRIGNYVSVWLNTQIMC